MNTEETLRERFRALWSAADDGADHVCRALFDQLNGPKRFYHGPQHIRHCLVEFDRVSHLLESPLAVELAIWFHDYIYHSESGNDEQESARGFAELAQDSLDQKLIDTVTALIIATEHQNPLEQSNSDLAYLLDIDLSSLGADWDQFMADGNALRNEQAELSDQEHYRNQAAFLARLERQNRIFKSDFFHDLYEQKARSNLQRYRSWREAQLPDIF